jgi:hypothetical protein
MLPSLTNGILIWAVGSRKSTICFSANGETATVGVDAAVGVGAVVGDMVGSRVKDGTGDGTAVANGNAVTVIGSGVGETAVIVMAIS